jgi:hypothetical protein
VVVAVVAVVVVVLAVTVVALVVVVVVVVEQWQLRDRKRTCLLTFLYKLTCYPD